MLTTRVFQSGNSQAVRIPQELRLNVKEVEIFQRGDEIILRPKRENLAEAFHILTTMPDDFMQNGREDTLPQQRDLEL